MNNADEMAFPELNSTETGLGSDGQQHSMHYSSGGLTKREHFAALAMQAILTGAVTRGCPAHEWESSEMAVKMADALLAALEAAPAQQSGDSHG